LLLTRSEAMIMLLIELVANLVHAQRLIREAAWVLVNLRRFFVR
jgi:hypothetical protein